MLIDFNQRDIGVFFSVYLLAFKVSSHKFQASPAEISLRLFIMRDSTCETSLSGAIATISRHCLHQHHPLFFQQKDAMFHAALASLFSAIIVLLGPCVISRGKKVFALNGVMNRSFYS